MNVADWIKKNAWTFAAAIVSVGLVGCVPFLQPKAPSLTDPKRWVTRAEIDAEVIAFEAKAKASYATLDAEDRALAKGIEFLSGLVQAVPGPWAGVGTAALSILTAGLFVDNRRKDGVVNGLKIATKARAGGEGQQ